jgi:tripartite-type tricarboxylate transporter receptor subunit TctC
MNRGRARRHRENQTMCIKISNTWIALVAALSFAAATVDAQPFPGRAMRIVVPVPPGGGVDVLSRAIGGRIAESTGYPVVIDNRPGASAVIGTDYTAKSPPDGYTMMMAYSAHVTNPHFNPRLPYDVTKDFAAVAHVGYIPLLLVVHPSLPARSLKELIALAHSRPGQIQFASGGAGAGAHLSGELLKYLARIDLIHVPYKGNAPALNDVLGGQVPIMFDTITTSIQHAKSGRLRALAVTSAKRASFAPEVPTMAEAGLPGFEVSAWYVILVPARTPDAVIAKLNTEINKAIGDPNLRERLGSQGVEFTGGTPQQAETFVRDEYERWGKVIKATGMKAD